MNPLRRTCWSAVVAGVLLTGLVGCAGKSSGTPAATASTPAAPAPSAPSGSGGTSAPGGGPEPSISYGPGASPGATTGPGVPEPTRRTPGQPDPTSDGPLDASALPDPIAGFRGIPLDPTEGEFNPNGTWTHAVDPALSSFQAIPTCGRTVDPPRAIHGLAGTYRGGDAPGHGLVLQFADEASARRWYATFVDQLAACPSSGGSVTVTELTRADQQFSNRRHTAFDNASWSEAGRLRGDRVVLIALGGSVDLARLSTDLRNFR